MAINTKSELKPYSREHIQNQSFDQEFQTNVTQSLRYDGINLQRTNADNMAMKVQTSGDITYFGLAAPGTAESTAKWQARKIDTSSGVVITWADGDSSFDNVATDLSSLTYS